MPAIKLTKLAQSNWLREKSLELGVKSPLISRFVAGSNFDEAADLVATFIERGQTIALNPIEPEPKTRQELADRVANYLSILAQVKTLDIADKTQLVVNLEQLGATFVSGQQLALANIQQICAKAAQIGCEILCDYNQQVSGEVMMNIVDQLRADFPKIGASIYVLADAGAEDHCAELSKIAHARVRLCRDYLEEDTGTGMSANHKADIRLVNCAKTLFESQAYPMIATHDSRIIGITQYLASQTGKQPTEYEFQVIQGLRPLEQQRLVDVGLSCRVRLPFGQAWLNYLASRLNNTPAELRSYLKTLVRRY